MVSHRHFSTPETLTEDQLKRKVAILHTGGTIGMVYNKSGFLDTSKYLLKNKILSLDTLNYAKEGKRPLFKHDQNEFEYDIIDLNPLIDSSDMDTQYYTEILTMIMQYYKSYSAFIILHGTDTLAYTAAMLGLFIENLSKPIFVTGSAYSIFENQVYSDAFSNLLSTFKYASTVRKAGVYVCCSDKLFDSATVKKFSSVTTDMFFYRNSLCQSFEEIPEELKTYSVSGEINFVFPKKINIASLFVTPMNHINIFKRVNLRKKEILLVHGYGNGNIPFCNSMLKTIEKHSENDGITIMISQCPDSYVLPLYSSWEKLNEVGAISSGSMTIEYIISKISYLKAKKTPWSLMKLLIYLDFNANYNEINQPEFCKNLLKLLDSSNVFEKKKHTESMEKMMEDINNGNLHNFFEVPLDYFRVYKNNQESFPSPVTSLIMRVLFNLFDLLLRNNYITL